MSYAAHSGLGHLARDFFRNGVVDRILVIPHSHYQNYPDWYPADRRFTRQSEGEFLGGLDVLLLFENAFHWDVVKRAKAKGIRVVLIPNYEYTPFPMSVVPDLVLCASLLDVDYYKDHYATAFLPIPVSMPWRLRERALTFVHNAGHGGYDWREGTPELLEAMKLVTSPARLTVRMQPGEERTKHLARNWARQPNVDLQYLERPEETGLWEQGDVCVAPQKYNGMSLPLQEAYASGMLVMTTNRYPMNTWLPKGPMFDPVGTERHKGRLAREIDRCILSPEKIAAKIDEWYNQDIRVFSVRGRVWGEAHSWDVLKPKYEEVLRG
mgnify:CR=1 FL=1